MKLAGAIAILTCAALCAAQDAVFMNPAPITIPDSGPGSLYPSQITASGVGFPIGTVEITLFQLSHTYPDDLDMLLVGPGGQSVLFMSDAGNGDDVVNINLSFSDFAAVPLPDASLITSGVYLPTNYGTGTRSPARRPPARGARRSMCLRAPTPTACGVCTSSMTRAAIRAASPAAGS